MEHTSADLALVLPTEISDLVAHVGHLHQAAEDIFALANAARALVR